MQRGPPLRPEGKRNEAIPSVADKGRGLAGWFPGGDGVVIVWYWSDVGSAAGEEEREEHG